MKKVFFALVCAMLSFSAIAGEKDEAVYYGPQQGSFAVSFSALPVVNFVGNMFNGTVKQTFNTNFGLQENFFDGSTLDVKYYVSDRWGITIGAGFNCFKGTAFGYSTEAGKENELVSKNISAERSVMLTLGAQYLLRPGRRLQPVLGARLMYAFNNNVSKGVDMVLTDQTAKESSPTSVFGIIGDLGVEFFFCKNVSLGAVANLGLGCTAKKEKYNGPDPSKPDERLNEARKTSSSSAFATGSIGGNLSLNFYF
jgi:hypothetical protein